MISDRFCGVAYSDKRISLLSYTAYLPTSGQDEEFLEVLAQLSADIIQHMQDNVAVIIGADTNQSQKLSKHRKEAMDQFRKDFLFKSILNSDEPTLHRNNLTSASQIDTILYLIPETTGIDLKFLEHLCKMNHSSNLSSHNRKYENNSEPPPKMNSQRNLQNIARYEESRKSLNLHEVLMEAHSKDISLQ